MMKKWMILSMVCMSATSLMAQHMSFGPTVGFGHSWLSSDNSGDKNRFHTSYNIGAKLVYSILTNWGVSADVKYSSEGGTIGADKDNKSIIRNNYIRVPVQAIYFFGKYGDRVRPKISVGPSVGFLVGAKEKEYDNGKVISDESIKPLLNKFDIGITAAVGANIRVGKGTWLNTDIAYYNGLSDISKGSGKLKGRSIGLNVGLLFPLGAK